MPTVGPLPSARLHSAEVLVALDAYAAALIACDAADARGDRHVAWEASVETAGSLVRLKREIRAEASLQRPVAAKAEDD